MVDLLEDLRLLDADNLDRQVTRLEEIYGEVTKELLIREIRDVIEEAVIELTNSGLKKISYELGSLDADGILSNAFYVKVHAFNGAEFSTNDPGHISGTDENKTAEVLQKEKQVLDFVKKKLQNEIVASSYLAQFYELDFDDFQL